MQQNELRFRALEAELEALRASLRDIHRWRADRSRAEATVRVKRAAAVVGLAALFAAGVGLGVGPSLGATPANASACGPAHTTHVRTSGRTTPSVTVECSRRSGARALLRRAKIDSVTGEIQLISPPPGVLFPPHPQDPCPTPGACLQSDTTMYAFDEQQCTKLSSDLPVDITKPGTYNDTSQLTGGSIAAGTYVSSQFVHVEPTSTQNGTIKLDGTVHTDTPILGIAVLDHALSATDVLGASGTLYPTGVFGRGLEFDTQNESLTLLPDSQTVEIHTQTRLHADQVRIITSCPPATIVVRKQTVPAGVTTQFPFTGDASGTIGDGQSIVVNGLAPGTYTSQEQVPSGWTLTSISCDDPNSSGDVSTATATFHVTAGQRVTCTFTDTRTNPTTSTVSTSTTTPTVPTTTPTTTSTTVPTTVTTTSTTTPQSVDVAVTKTASKPLVSVGQEVSYQIVVTNSGPGTALDVVLVDILPSREKLISVTGASCSGTTAVTCTLGQLPAGGQQSIRVLTLARSAGVATDVATVSTSSPETNTANNQATATVTIQGPFRPPPLCEKLSTGLHVARIGQPASLVVLVRRQGRPLAGARVQVRGAAILLVRKSDARGAVRFELEPQHVGVIAVRVLQSPSCPSAPAYVRITAPHRSPTYTG